MIFLPLCDRWSVRVRRRDAGERLPVRRGTRQHGSPPAAQLPADPAARESGAARQLPGGQERSVTLSFLSPTSTVHLYFLILVEYVSLAQGPV
ncbi:hypothetical protein AVEN_133867-1 [Araneus ventricosus]|uniref:Uncharacterized protein n=1 Tax=Araneus ventricosus TaxID=182803 RepID=A0A4Y2S0Y5_ARAVE|nr:hypothetical protein AVEN_133867-1 [Araneus ventricosus]